MKKILALTLFILSGSVFADPSRPKLDFSKMEIPSLNIELTASDNPYYVNRELLISNGSILDDQFWLTGKGFARRTLKIPQNGNYCILKLAYGNFRGFPIGQITIEPSTYPIGAYLAPGRSNFGPFRFDKNAPTSVITVQTDNELLSQPITKGYAQVPAEYETAIAGQKVLVQFSKIYCVSKVITKDAVDYSNEKHFMASLGEWVSVESTAKP